MLVDFKLRIVSSSFAGHRLVARHRMVYEILKEEMQTTDTRMGIHALQMDTKTPEEEEKESTK